MHTHTCRPLPDHTTTIEVQDGWEGPPFVPDGTYTRRPVMRLHTTQWGPVVCGYHARATDPACPEACPGKHWREHEQTQ